MGKSLKYLLTAGLALGSYLPIANGQASATNLPSAFKEETIGENYKITQKLENTTPGTMGESLKAFYQFDVGVDLSSEGCTNFQNDLNWEYDGNSKLENYTGVDHFVNLARDYSYEVPTNSVVGWRFVPATFTANNGDTANLDGGFKVPITPYTTANTGGKPTVQVLGLAGLLDLNSTNELTMAEVNAAATEDGNDNGIFDWKDYQILEGTNFTANVGFNTNDFPVITWNGKPDKSYEVQSKGNLADTNATWQTVGTTNTTGNATNVLCSIADTNSPVAGSNFYRLSETDSP